MRAIQACQRSGRRVPRSRQATITPLPRRGTAPRFRQALHRPACFVWPNDFGDHAMSWIWDWILEPAPSTPPRNLSPSPTKGSAGTDRSAMLSPKAAFVPSLSELKPWRSSVGYFASATRLRVDVRRLNRRPDGGPGGLTRPNSEKRPRPTSATSRSSTSATSLRHTARQIYR
jgi:hypothetical protein